MKRKKGSLVWASQDIRKGRVVKYYNKVFNITVTGSYSVVSGYFNLSVWTPMSGGKSYVKIHSYKTFAAWKKNLFKMIAGSRMQIIG